MINQEITRKIITAAMRIHTKLGRGLLESAYREFLFYDLVREGLNVEKEKTIPVQYAGVKQEHGYRIDLLVDRRVVVELKTVEELRQVHFQQMLTYLRLGDFSTGLLINFHVASLKYGLRRMSNSRVMSTHFTSLE
jgi:GxxExxY protein